MAIWYISWTFGIFHGHFVYFMDIWYISVAIWDISQFWYVVPKKSGNPGSPCEEIEAFYLHEQ
jgi:hypothetical protein